jgi:hypothetical protein
VSLDFLDAPEPTKVPRDRWDRPLIVPPSGGKAVPYQRVTTFIDCVEDKSTLTRWAKRMVLIGACADPSIITEASATGDPRDHNRLAERALEAAKANDKREKGTHLHALSEYVDRGEPLPAVVTPDGGPPAEVSDQDRADMEAYRLAMDPLDVEHIETLTVHDGLRVAGTPDRIVRYQGRFYIADLKTGSVDFGALKMAMQLAIYSRSEFYDHETQSRAPLPSVDQDRAIIAHLPAGSGTCSLLWLDIAAGWAAVDVARRVREARALKNVLSPFGGAA